MLEFSASNFAVAYVRKQAGIKWKEMKEGRLIYLPFGIIPLDRVAKICDKLQTSIMWTQSFKLMQLGTGTLNLLPILFSWSHFMIVQLSMQPVWFVDKFIASHSCIRNNIVKTDLRLHWQNILSFYTVKSAHRVYKTYLVDSVIIQKKLSRSNG